MTERKNVTAATTADVPALASGANARPAARRETKVAPLNAERNEPTRTRRDRRDVGRRGTSDVAAGPIAAAADGPVATDVAVEEVSALEPGDDATPDVTRGRETTRGEIAAAEARASDVSGGPALPDAEPQKEKLSADMKDAFRRFRHSQLAQRSSRVALALSQLMRIRLPYPRQIEAMAEIEELRLLGLEMRGEQQLALNIFNRTGTGKSTIASQYKLMRAEEDVPGVTSVLHARMGSSGSARDLYVAIMSEIGDGFASAGNENTLRRRAMHAMADLGVELLILDETQHSGQKSGFSREVTAELKIMLDTGRVPIVLLGTEAAVPLVAADRELSGRMFSPCRLDPLDMNDDDDFELWQGFVGGLDARMVSDGIVSAKAGLAEEEVALALGEVCDGVIGQVMRVMTMALRNTVRDRRDVVTIEDIAVAVDEWSLEHGFADRNPFRRS